MADVVIVVAVTNKEAKSPAHGIRSGLDLTCIMNMLLMKKNLFYFRQSFPGGQGHARLQKELADEEDWNECLCE